MVRTSQIVRMSNGDFALLGANRIAYVKPVLADGVKVFEIHAADGTPITRAPSWEIATAVVRQHDLELVWVS
jgi:hypothetical protein